MTRELFARATDEPADPSTDDRIIEVALQSLPGVVAASDSPERSAGSSSAHAEHSTGASNRPARGCTATAGSNTRSDRPRPSLRSAAAGAASHRPTRPRPQPHHRTTAARRHPRRTRRPLVQDRLKQRTRGPAEPAQARRPHHGRRRDPDHPRPETAYKLAPTCANSQRRTSCAHPAGCFHSPVYAQSSASRKTTRPTPTRRQLLKNS